MVFKSRAVQSLVELHRQELLHFLSTWERFNASGLALLPASGDPNYQSSRHLYAHVLESARSDLVWVCQLCGIALDAPDPKDPHAILKAYMRHLPELSDEALYVPRNMGEGMNLSLEAILEHAIVHSMRHRHQLERLLEGDES
ncbi:MAG: hypothetical protein L6R28_04315 [Planctomycetes bacterium]|nr:hypothetical protein [Planctomycetota bacterium]